MVSPTPTVLISLIEAVKNPTSPGPKTSLIIILGVWTPTSMTSYFALEFINSIMSPFLTVPFITRIEGITPLYGSYIESKTNAWRGAFASPFGAGISVTIRSKISIIPTPSLADAKTASCAGIPIISSISSLTFVGSALGRSILFITGMISKSLSIAKYTLASVWASMPWAASTTKTAPSHAASDLETSYVKSTCPGVSMRWKI